MEVDFTNQQDTLVYGISLLCQDDPDIDDIIAPRRRKIISLLDSYINEIENHNPALSLVGTNCKNEIIIRHILDSLAPLGIIFRECGVANIADVGSGAGLPGVPLAIALPLSDFTLIERKGRRAGFLRSIRSTLGLSNISIEEQEMEKVKPGRFKLVIFRAFRSLEPKIIKKLFRLCGDDGILAAYKGREEKIRTEMEELEKSLPQLTGKWKIIPCQVPFLDEQRHLLLISK
ncbi:MAG: 16S rRNA (guanine(527)-N(7))-methyltransferase RsmG [Treponema sp.]|jgi:16S rRNA (guanine527-N7)-methyltransferase|nr:16S rRNA (guanine(527)-N(7))-methyltransferase RsmG [Treponema sp.]